MHSAVTTSRASRGTTVVNDVMRVVMSGTRRAAAVSLSPRLACQQASVMAAQQELPMERRSWMPWCPSSHLAPAQPKQMAGTRRAGLDQVSEPCLRMSMRTIAVWHWRR